MMARPQSLRLRHGSIERRVKANAQRAEVLVCQSVVNVVHAGRGHAQGVHVADRGDAELVELAHRLEQRSIEVRLVEHHIEQNVRCLRLGQKTVGLAVVKVADEAALGRRGVAIDADRLKRGGIAPNHVHRKVRKHNRAIDVERVEATAVGVGRILPCGRIPALAVDPRVVGVLGGKLRHGIDAGLLARQEHQIAAEVLVFLDGAERKVHVRIVESGHDQLVARIDHLGIGTDKRLHLVGCAHGDDLVAANRDASRMGLKLLGRKQRRRLNDDVGRNHRLHDYSPSLAAAACIALRPSSGRKKTGTTESRKQRLSRPMFMV